MSSFSTLPRLEQSKLDDLTVTFFKCIQLL